ncbi:MULTISPECIES: MarR family winged helix-turn-helix transcriptional regulator [unclassified Thioalkalivibrio]|uniref:MarR family winged helix-turn-helix transcriptional regulator n=1 Tax=unclassified Thioalkalivibrio TaxID=2621013 RepID=UPI000373C3D5|nr:MULTISPECIES: MarR family transcriptional regulator [unclassified Thioalkalivibrio]
MTSTQAVPQAHDNESGAAAGTSGEPDLARSVIRQLRVIIRALQGHSRTVERACGISASQLWALWELQRTPGLNVSDLSRRLSVHASTTSNLLDKLEHRGLIERRRPEKDQRIVRLYVTDAGLELLDQAPAAPQGELNRALQSLPKGCLEELDQNLDLLVEAMNTTEPRAGLQPFDGKA